MDRYEETRDSWNKVARLYQDNFMHLTLYDHTYDHVCRLLPAGAKVLEIGCGPGNITRYLHTQRPDLHIEAIDNSPQMIELAKQNNPDVLFIEMDCRQIGTISQQYEAIVCGFCLPYLSAEDCEALFADCRKLLSPGGLLYLSFVEGDPSLSGYHTGSSGDRMFFYYHKLDSVQAQLNQNGFGPLTLYQVDFPRKETTETHTIVIVPSQHKQPSI